MIRFSKRAFLFFIILLAVEIYIGAYVRDDFIRPYVGDVLVVALIFYFVKAFIRINDYVLATGVLLFAFTVETGQYFDLVTRLGLQDFELARIVIGTSFSWYDMLAYVVGIVLTLLVERFYAEK